MLFGAGVYCRIWHCLHCCLLSICNFIRLITSVGEERVCFFLLSITRIFVVSARKSSISSGCLGKATLSNLALPGHTV